jgi:catechol 2,3-dioxygenase-like lactoylglutathione lyase family enzyme
MRVTGLDHIVLLCRDVEASLSFYVGTLGLDAEQVDEWRGGTAFFPSVRISDDSIIDLLPGGPDGRNVDHFCVVLEPTDLHALAARDDLDVVEGPVERGGARGVGWSVYVRDPDGHLIELKQYGVDAAGRAER